VGVLPSIGTARFGIRTCQKDENYFQSAAQGRIASRHIMSCYTSRGMWRGRCQPHAIAGCHRDTDTHAHAYTNPDAHTAGKL